MVLYGKDQAPAQLLAVAFPAAIIEAINFMALFSFSWAALSALPDLRAKQAQNQLRDDRIERKAHTSLQQPTGSSQV
jgi:hypothetical protein